MARIAHLDADAFFYSVALQQDPTLLGKAVIVASDSPRSVVSTASYEARKRGVSSGMSVVRAKELVPGILFARPDFESYRQVSGQIWEIVSKQLGTLEQAGLDEAYADLTGKDNPVALLKQTIKEVKQQTGIQLSAGLGPNRLVAKVASDADKPQGFLVLSREQACRQFAKSSPGLIPGIGPKTQQALAQLGIHTLQRLSECPEAMLSGQFSKRSINELKAKSRFYGSEEIQTVRTRKSRSAEETFAVDLTDPAKMESELRLLADRVSRDLQSRQQAGATVGIKVRLADWTSYTRDHTLQQPTNDAQEILDVASGLMNASLPEGPVRLLGVRVGGLDRPESITSIETQLKLFA